MTRMSVNKVKFFTDSQYINILTECKMKSTVHKLLNGKRHIQWQALSDQMRDAGRCANIRGISAIYFAEVEEGTDCPGALYSRRDAQYVDNVYVTKVYIFTR